MWHFVRISLLSVVLVFSHIRFVSSQTYWKIETDRGEEILLTLETDLAKKTFLAHTRKDALKELGGTVPYLAAKTAGYLKYPEIIHAEGSIRTVADTTFYTGNFIYFDKTNFFEAKTWGDFFKGTITDEKSRKNYFTGVKLINNSPLRDYKKITLSAFSLTEKYIYDRKLVQTSDWRNFKNKINEFLPKITDDYEMGATFYWYKRSLDDIPFEISKLSKLRPVVQKMTSPEKVKEKTAYLDINRLPDSSEAMTSLFKIIEQKGYTNLIVDAGGRRLIDLKSVIYLTNHLTGKPLVFGAFVTRKYTDSNPAITQEDFEKLDASLNDFETVKNGIRNENGVFIRTEPVQPVFKGKVYILVTARTQGISEALAIWGKVNKIAQIAGQKTSGYPMLFESVNINSMYYINLPVAWYYDSNGKNHNRISVEPDIKLPKGDNTAELTKVLRDL